MNHKPFSFGLLAVYFLTSCSSTKPLVFIVKPNQINEIGLLPPVSMVKQVSQATEVNNVNELNEQIETNMATVFGEISSISDVPYSQVALSPQNTAIVYKEIFRCLDTLLAYRREKRKQIYPASGKFGFEENRALFSALTLSDTTVSILKSSNKRFLTFILTTGSTRSVENAKALRQINGAKNALGIGLGLLTGYGFYSIQNLYFCETHVLILDTEKKNYTFYNLIQTENGNPAQNFKRKCNGCIYGLLD